MTAMGQAAAGRVLPPPRAARAFTVNRRVNQEEERS